MIQKILVLIRPPLLTFFFLNWNFPLIILLIFNFAVSLLLLMLFL